MLGIDEMYVFCKKKGFIFQNSEIYGGMRGFFDYGPLGSELKKNIKDDWGPKIKKRIQMQLFLFIFITIPLIVFFYFFYIYNLLIGIIISLICIVLILPYHILEILAISDNKKDLIIYQNGISIPSKPIGYILKHKNWFVPFSKIEAIRKEKGRLYVIFKDNFSESKSFPVFLISDWKEFEKILSDKIMLDI